jgi:hypothetical protein
VRDHAQGPLCPNQQSSLHSPRMLYTHSGRAQFGGEVRLRMPERTALLADSVTSPQDCERPVQASLLTRRLLETRQITGQNSPLRVCQAGLEVTQQRQARQRRLNCAALRVLRERPRRSIGRKMRGHNSGQMVKLMRGSVVY